MMRHHRLADPRARHHACHPCRNEAVHAAHDPDLLDHRGAVELEPASIVVDVDARHLPDQPVGEEGRNLAQDDRVLARLATAGAKVEIALLELTDHPLGVERSEERRVVKECVSTFNSCVYPSNSKTKKPNQSQMK